MSGKKKFNLTLEQIKEFQRAAQTTWQTIAYDTLQCIAESEEKDINKVVMKKAEVIECVLDADYILTHGGIKDPVVKDFYKNGDYDQMIEILNEDFKYARYGL